MLCINCKKEMKHKCETRRLLDFSGTADDEELEYTYEEYRCSSCRIKYVDYEWILPKKLQPSEKQKKTILFIKNRLSIEETPITANQHWLFINKYFKKAQKVILPRYSSGITYEDLEMMGYNEADFY